MRLTTEALKAINKKNIRPHLCLELDISDITLKRYIQANDKSLTQAGVLALIEEKTGLKQEQILEASPATV